MALARAGGFYKIVNLLWAWRSFCLTRSTADPVSSLAWPGKEPRAGSSWNSGIHGFLSHSMGSTKLLLLLRTEEQKVHSSSTSRGRQQRVRAECPWAASPQPDTATADSSIARGSDCWQSSFGSSRTLLLSGTSRSLTPFLQHSVSAFISAARWTSAGQGLCQLERPQDTSRWDTHGQSVSSSTVLPANWLLPVPVCSQHFNQDQQFDCRMQNQLERLMAMQEGNSKKKNQNIHTSSKPKKKSFKDSRAYFCP